MPATFGLALRTGLLRMVRNLCRIRRRSACCKKVRAPAPPELVRDKPFAIRFEKLDIGSTRAQRRAVRGQKVHAVAAHLDGAEQRAPFCPRARDIGRGQQHAIDFRKHDRSPRMVPEDVRAMRPSCKHHPSYLNDSETRAR